MTKPRIPLILQIRGSPNTSTQNPEPIYLKPENDNINATRSNLFFDEGGNPVFYEGKATGCFKNSSRYTFEPRDEVKGDVARMIMYMAVRYEGENGEPDLEMTETIYNDTDKQPFMGVKSTLLKWHKQDPVSEFEQVRNNHVFTFQGNRNPFIDHPEFASLIWEPTTSVPETTNDEILITINKTSIIINSPKGISSLEIYSITGQLIQQQKPAGQKSISIPKATLPRGIHIIKINQSSTFKILN
ncbi:MAG: endonuclease [Breznakibacter sp.]